MVLLLIAPKCTEIVEQSALQAQIIFRIRILIYLLRSSLTLLKYVTSMQVSKDTRSIHYSVMFMSQSESGRNWT